MALLAHVPQPRDVLSALQAELGKVILGKPEVIRDLLTALRHILMEDVPGVGKTTLAKALARAFDAEFKRVQFTPDLLPSDILGSSVYSPRDGTFSAGTTWSASRTPTRGSKPGFPAAGGSRPTRRPPGTTPPSTPAA
jgi:MoxR-like ATPase